MKTSNKQFAAYLERGLEKDPIELGTFETLESAKAARDTPLRLDYPGGSVAVYQNSSLIWEEAI